VGFVIRSTNSTGCHVANIQAATPRTGGPVTPIKAHTHALLNELEDHPLTIVQHTVNAAVGRESG